MFHRFQSRTSEAAKLEAEVSKAQETIKAAEALINQLDREHRRWSAQVCLRLCSEVTVAQLCRTLCNPMDYTVQGHREVLFKTGNL